MHRNLKRIIMTAAALVFLLPLQSQKMVNSPYSRFGLGLIETTYNFRSAGMGGTSLALRDNTSVSWLNPASYSSIDTNSFVFDFGADYGMAFLKNENFSHFSEDMNFDHMIISFPVARGVGFSAGLTPYSNGYYYISRTIDENDPDYDPIAGDVIVSHKGTGGFTRIFAGTGVKLFRGLSAGANLNVIFGSVKRINEHYFESDASLFNSRFEENLRMNGMSISTGMQYEINLAEKKSLVAAISYEFGSNLRSDYDNIFLKFTSYNLPPYSPDTITSEVVENGNVKLPSSFGIGLSYNVKDKLSATAEYYNTRWSEAAVYGSTGMLASTSSIRAGVEYTPDRFSIFNFFDRVDYRLGGHMSENYLLINGEQLKEFGITFGAGIPMARSWSKLNLYFDWTSRGGSLSNGLHRENCFTIGLSLNLYDYWFMKAKYE